MSMSAFGVEDGRVSKGSFEEQHGRPPRTAYEKRTGKVHGIAAVNTQTAKKAVRGYECDHCGKPTLLHAGNKLREHRVPNTSRLASRICPGSGAVPKAMRLF